MSDNLPPCPECSGAYTYEMGALLVCPECGHEWSPSAQSADGASGSRVIKDAVGNVLADGDTVTVIKDLKVKGTSETLKRGTLVKNIRLTSNAEEVECNTKKVKGLVLKTQFLKKA